MPHVPDAVPEECLDYDEIFRRGGTNFGDEDFALCKCPQCCRVYLVEYEVDTVYLDPSDLSRRIGVPIGGTFKCEACGRLFPAGTVWIGPDAPRSMQVTWGDLAASEWRWVATPTRDHDV